MEPKPDPPTPNRNKNVQDVGESSSSSTPNQEPEPLLISNYYLGELVFEILARLPAKSLLRFKCVSKSWLSLISSPRFIEAHLAIASEMHDYAHQALILSVNTLNDDDEPKFKFQHEIYSVSSLLYGPADETPIPGLTDVGHLTKHPSKSFVVAGSCNGLICIYNYASKELFLWNPCIKNSKKLPSTGMKLMSCHASFGFGYDKLNEDYKVVGVFSACEKPCTVWKAYSLKNDCWIEIEDSKIRRPGLTGWEQYFLHERGKLHWFFSEGSEGWTPKIACFDLTNETYEEMDGPNFGSFLYSTRDSGLVGEQSELGVLGGCISVLFDHKRTHLDVWVMKEYGVKDSWTKLAFIPCIGEGPKFGRFQPVCLSRNGEILFVLGSVLLLYDPERNSFRRYPQIGYLSNAIMYVESLVSPNAYGI